MGKQLVWVEGDEDRKHFDYYDTPADCTQAFVDWAIRKGVLTPTLHISELGDVIWEPACGSGAMSKVLEENKMTVFSSDIRPNTGYGVGGQNFLQYTGVPGLFTAVFTNPPFYFAQDFIVQAHFLGIPTICMLLKSTYFHAKRRIPLFRKYPPAWILPMTWRPSMNPEAGNSGMTDFSWYVWQVGNKETDTRFDILERPTKKEK